MATHREGVNPLRPYYIPPTIGESPDYGPGSFSGGGAAAAGGGNATNAGRYASKARDMFGDLDYNQYLGDDSPSMVQNAKSFLDELIWKYTSVLMAQPFEAAKLILQVRSQDANAAITGGSETDYFNKRTASNASASGSMFDQYGESDSEGDEPAYFTSNIPNTPSPLNRSQRGHDMSTPLRTPKSPKKMTLTEPYLNIRRPDSIIEVISQLWQKEGAWGVWKGSNATFLYTVLQSLLENWSRSFLSAIFNVPDFGVKDDLDRLVDIASPYPWASMFVAGAAAIATGVLLAPLDLVRTRLILTPSSKGQRRTLATLRSLPSHVCSSIIMIPTVLHSLMHPILTLSTPLVLRSRFMIDSRASPMAFSFAKFMASSAAILVKLPLETVLRRGQATVLSSKPYVQTLDQHEQKLDTVVALGRYDGVTGTMYHIATEEGSREVPAKPAATKKGKAKAKTAQSVYRKGQGLEGLWRGWKVNWWGLVGLWMAGVVGNGGEGEF